MEKLDLVEERLAHLMRSVDDLSDIVAAQRKELDRLNRLVGLLVEREALGGESPSANQRPPHW